MEVFSFKRAITDQRTFLTNETVFFSDRGIRYECFWQDLHLNRCFFNSRIVRYSETSFSNNRTVVVPERMILEGTTQRQWGNLLACTEEFLCK